MKRLWYKVETRECIAGIDGQNDVKMFWAMSYAPNSVDSLDSNYILIVASVISEL
jgi:hypothetical protein